MTTFDVYGPQLKQWPMTFLSVLVLLDVAVSSLLLSGQVVSVNDIPYYVPATPLTYVNTSVLQRLHGVGELIPATVIDRSPESIGSTIATYGQVDDVWNQGFLEGRPLNISFRN